MSLGATDFPRLLAGLPASGAMSWSEHEAVHGPPLRFRREGSRHPLIRELDRAGLRGYGGAGFPTATKFQAVAKQRGRPSVVVNAAEGEPLSGKDVLLVRRLPHLVLDGAIAAAGVLGSDRIVFAVDEHAESALRAIQQAAAERPETARGRGPQISVGTVPSGYLTGQETALLNVLGGGPALPTQVPPYPFERGLQGRPTLVSNAETFAQVGLVARHGSGWWRSLGTDDAPATRLVTVSGAVATPGVVEVAGGTSLQRLLEASGGTTETLQALLLGGYAGTWIGPEQVETPIDTGGLSQHSAGLGAGIVFALPQSACAVAEVAAATRWLQRQSAGQCGPCVHGLGAIADALQSLCERGDRRGAYRQIEHWCALVNRRGACALPDGAANFVTSALRVLGPEFDDHAHHGACDVCYERRWLPSSELAVAV